MLKPRELSQLTAFATLGTWMAVEDVVRAVLASIPEAEAELVAEETMVWLSMATARALEAGLRGHPEAARALAQTLEELPLLYRDYLTASLVLATENPEMGSAGEEMFRRLRRKQEFYRMHLPEGRYPADRQLHEVMTLWMGRISPPGLPESPEQRLEKLNLLPLVRAHLRTVLARCRQLSAQ